MSAFRDAQNRRRIATFAALDAQADVYQMEPLVVTLTLGTPIAIGRPFDLALDGIVAHTLLHQAFAGDLTCLPPPETDPLFLRLPLAVQGPAARRATSWRWGRALSHTDLQQPWWYAVSTTEIVDSVAHATHYWNKRFDTKFADVLDPATKTVVIEKGRYKAYHQPLPTITCRALRWQVMGDRAALTALLEQVDYIGKKRAYGEAAIIERTVTPDTTDHSLYRADGGLARPVPLMALPEMGLTDWSRDVWDTPPSRLYVAYRAPQWLPANQAECAWGGQRRIAQVA